MQMSLFDEFFLDVVNTDRANSMENVDTVVFILWSHCCDAKPCDLLNQLISRMGRKSKKEKNFDRVIRNLKLRNSDGGSRVEPIRPKPDVKGNFR